MSLPGEEWFHTALFAKAHFRTQGFRVLANSQYAADGQLTLTGMTSRECVSNLPRKYENRVGESPVVLSYFISFSLFEVPCFHNR